MSPARVHELVQRAEGPLAVVLGLDLATHAGYSVWAIEQEPRLREAGEIDCSIITPSSKNPDPEGLRFHLLRTRLIWLLAKWDVTHVYLERTVGGPTAGGAAALVSAGMTAIVQETCYDQSLVCDDVSTGTVKKHATGNGGHETKKQHMIAAFLHQFPGVEVLRRKPTKSKPWTYDDDVIDALWVGHYGCFQLLGTKRVVSHKYTLIEPALVGVGADGLVIKQISV